jgi:hypothetical protein
MVSGKHLSRKSNAVGLLLPRRGELTELYSAEMVKSKRAFAYYTDSKRGESELLGYDGS